MPVTNKSGSMNVKLGVCNFCTPGMGAFAARFTAMAGLDGMSLDLGFRVNGYPLACREVQKAYLEDQQRYGIELPNIGLSCLDFLSLMTRPGQADYDEVQWVWNTAIETAAAMDIHQLLLPAFAESEIKTEDDFEYAVELFRRISLRAAEHGITIGSENVLPFAKQRELVERVGCENFGLFYDSQNFFFNKDLSQTEALEVLYDLLVPQLHVKDGRRGELSGRVVGEGESDFAGSMKILHRRGWNGWIILENYYEQYPLRGRNLDVWDIFMADVAALRAAVAEETFNGEEKQV